MTVFMIIKSQAQNTFVLGGHSLFWPSYNSFKISLMRQVIFTLQTKCRRIRFLVKSNFPLSHFYARSCYTIAFLNFCQNNKGRISHLNRHPAKTLRYLLREAIQMRKWQKFWILKESAGCVLRMRSTKFWFGMEFS